MRRATDKLLRAWRRDSRACPVPISLDRKVIELVDEVLELRHTLRSIDAQLLEGMLVCTRCSSEETLHDLDVRIDIAEALRRPVRRPR